MAMQKITINCPRCGRTSFSFYFLSHGQCPDCGLEYNSNILIYRRISGVIAILLIWILDMMLSRILGDHELIVLISLIVTVILLDFFLIPMFVRLVPRK